MTRTQVVESALSAAASGLVRLTLSAPAFAFGPTAGPEPCGAVPSAAQAAWHDLKFYGFVHFTTNTFTDREWGYGDESPDVFAPTDLDCRQWATVAKSAGMTGLILTAKHHDGFCLWPASSTKHSVASSAWRGGAGDVVREFVDACRAEGLLVGMYLSPWDRNAADYGSPAYVERYRADWRELIEQYGPFFEVWFDGANGGDGFYGGAREVRTIDRETYYGWDATNQMLRSLLPDVIAFSDAGPGCRWVGNESGVAPETSWQTLNLAGRYPGCPCADTLGVGEPGGTHWVGVECDVSIRPGWFHHDAEDARVKTGAQLVDLHFSSVGHGANLLLNVPPDRRGRWHERDVESLMDMRRRLDALFSMNAAAGATVTATSTWPEVGAQRFDAAAAVDDDRSTFWCAAEGDREPMLEIVTAGEAAWSIAQIEEPIHLGQRIESLVVEVHQNGAWREWGRATSIGARRLIRGPEVKTDRVRIRVLGSRCTPLISHIALWSAGPQVPK